MILECSRRLLSDHQCISAFETCDVDQQNTRPLSLKTGDLQCDRCWFRRAQTLQEIGDSDRIIARDTPDGPLHRVKRIERKENSKGEMLKSFHSYLRSSEQQRPSHLASHRWHQHACTLKETGHEKIVEGDTPNGLLHVKPMDGRNYEDEEILAKFHEQLESLNNERAANERSSGSRLYTHRWTAGAGSREGDLTIGEERTGAGVKAWRNDSFLCRPAASAWVTNPLATRKSMFEAVCEAVCDAEPECCETGAGGSKATIWAGKGITDVGSAIVPYDVAPSPSCFIPRRWK
ncbi:uncharacterized protein BT62DRAFT_922947 [Guyanagaster necrorhizus]|uniref:Uncharacterized protein n=1 Tax=Guyanagaster necrorhizus TaxID=856835 RepID=A0A9P7VIV9_9AGAR|nr:uncharacterized protein BT62DRAFT_922947 [Guyanagaster necrorhizus MCA 3950]KAG7441913.1 hypothetical protein BT62DRAFT_922947 [Guyanagaster necrorhizus MCA 3950]